jgi:hypothetical protein
MVRFASFRVVFVLLVCAAGSAGRLSAQELEHATVDDGAAATLAAPAPLAEPTQLSAPAPSLPKAAELGQARQRRPDSLVPLYVSFGALQVLDTHSTWRALHHGAVEANPMLKGVVGSQAGLIALKAAGTAGVIFASEKMWKRNRTASMVFMVAANSAMAWVVQNNYRAVR